jgi:protein SYS1
MPFHGRERFEPALILAQIIILQAAFYLSFTLLLLVLNRALGVQSLVSAQIFDHRALTLREFGGWVTAAALLVANLSTALTYVLLVGRAKRCLDFAVTIFVAHAIATVFHSGIPASLSWWCVNLMSVSVLAIVSEAMCMRIEMREISVQSAGRPSAGSPPRKASPPADAPPLAPDKGQAADAGVDLEDPLLVGRSD